MGPQSRLQPTGARLAQGASDRLEASFRQRLEERKELEGGQLPVRRLRRRVRWGPVHLAWSTRDLLVGGLVAASLTLLVVAAAVGFIALAGLIALVFAWFRSQWVNRQDSGTEEMQTIARHTRTGAHRARRLRRLPGMEP